MTLEKTISVVPLIELSLFLQLELSSENIPEVRKEFFAAAVQFVMKQDLVKFIPLKKIELMEEQEKM